MSLSTAYYLVLVSHSSFFLVLLVVVGVVPRGCLLPVPVPVPLPVPLPVLPEGAEKEGEKEGLPRSSSNPPS